MFWRYIKAQVMVLLCGGLVGPIFLAVYFATGQEPILKWMFYVGLLITAADILIALALANFSAKSAAKTHALEAERRVGVGPDHRDRRNGHPHQRPAGGEAAAAHRGPGHRAVRLPGPRDRQRDAAGRTLTNRKLVVLVDPPPRIPNRLGAKRS